MNTRRPLVLAQVLEVHGTRVAYPCCGNCYSKLHRDTSSGRFCCLKCGSSYPSDQVPYRYRLGFTITDGLTESAVSVFGRNLDPFFGASANQFVQYVQDAERCSSVCMDNLLNQSFSQTFLGQMFVFGFKTKKPVRTDPINGECVSLQTVADCSLLHKSNSESDTTGLKDYGRTLIAWQMIQANVNQQIQPVLKIVKMLVSQSERAVDLSVGTETDDPMDDSLFGLCNNGNDSLQVSTSSFCHQRTLILSCEEKNRSHSQVSSATTENSFLDELADTSIERLRADVSSSETDLTKPCFNCDDDSRCFGDKLDESDIDTHLIGSQNMTFPAPTRPVPKNTDCAEESVHISDIDFDETLDIGNNLQSLVLDQIDTANLEHTGTSEVKVRLLCSLDNTALNQDSASESLKRDVFCSAGSNQLSLGDATFTALDGTNIINHYRKAICDTQEMFQLCDNLEDEEEELSSHSDDSSLLLECGIQNPEHRGTGLDSTGEPSRFTKTEEPLEDVLGSEVINGNEEVAATSKEVEMVEQPAAATSNDCFDAWSDFPESEDLSAFLLLAAGAQLEHCQDQQESTEKSDSCQDLQDSEEKASNSHQDAQLPPDAITTESLNSNSKPGQPRQASLSSKVIHSETTSEAPLICSPKAEDNKATSKPCYEDEEYFPESKDLDAFLQQLSHSWNPEPMSVKSVDQVTKETEQKLQVAEGLPPEERKALCDRAVQRESDSSQALSNQVVIHGKSLNNDNSQTIGSNSAIHRKDSFENRAESYSVAGVQSAPHSDQKVVVTLSQSFEKEVQFDTNENTLSPSRRLLQDSLQLSPSGLSRSPTKFNLRQFAKDSADDSLSATRAETDDVSISECMEGSADLFDVDDDMLTLSNLSSAAWNDSTESEGSDNVFTDSEDPECVSRRPLVQIRRVTHISDSVSSPKSIPVLGETDTLYDPSKYSERRTSVWFAPKLSTVEDISNIDFKMLSTPSPEPTKLSTRRRSCLKRRTSGVNVEKDLISTMSHAQDVESQDLFCSPVVSTSPQQQNEYRSETNGHGRHYQSTPLSARGDFCMAGTVDKGDCNHANNCSLNQITDSFEEGSVVPPSCPSIVALKSPVSRNVQGASPLTRIDSPDLFGDSRESVGEDTRNSLNLSDSDVIPSSPLADRKHGLFLSVHPVLDRTRQKLIARGRQTADQDNSSQDLFGED